MLNDTIKLLCLESYEDQIETIDLIKEDNHLMYHLKLKRQYIPCLACGSIEQNIHSHLTKKLTHSMHTSMVCYLVIHYHRYRCKHCKAINHDRIIISNPYEKISLYTRMNILNDLRKSTNTFTAIANTYHVSIQTIINIFDAYVKPKRLQLPEIICLDEFYLGKRSKTKYACVLLDFISSDVIEVYDTRHKHKLIEQLLRIPLIERMAVKHVIIDMWDSYRAVIQRCFPNATVAVDSFHVIWHLNKAMSDIRIRVMRRFKNDAVNLINNDIYYYMLKKFYFFLLVDYDRLSRFYVVPKLKTKFSKDNLLHYLLSIDEELKLAYELKELYRDFNKTSDQFKTIEQLQEIIKKFRGSKSEEMKSVGKMLNTWRDEILNSFIKTGGKRLSNSKIENKNSQIKTIMKTANGYKNFNRLRSRIIYSLNRNTPIKG